MKAPLAAKVLLVQGLALGFYIISLLPVSAQDRVSARELQHIIAAQHARLEAQQRQLDAQKELLRDLQARMETFSRPEPAADWRTITTEAPAQLRRVDDETAARNFATSLSHEYRHDRVHPPGPEVRRNETKLKAIVPGTSTEIGVHGFAEFQAIYETNGSNNNEFDTFLIPIPKEPGQTKFSVNPSRIALSSLTPTEHGRIKTFISMDFNGELDQPVPRLREAYGEIIFDVAGASLLAGQTYATMLDLKSVPETLDFAGPTGYFARRQPMLRATATLRHDLKAELALETPENVAYIDGTPLTRLPDFVMTGTWNIGGPVFDHFRLAGLVRDLRAEDDDGAEATATGWAVGVSGKMLLPLLGPKDNFKFGAQVGEGFGAQLKSGPADGILNPANSALTTIGVFSAYGGLQHWWRESLRSNFVFGHLVANNPDFVDGSELNNTTYLATDLIWNPYPSVTVGIEYLWGRLENQDSSNAVSNRFLFSSRYDF